MKKPREKLNAQEAQVIKLRYARNWKVVKTLAEVGKIMGGVTRQRIRQIEKEAVRKLGKNMGRKRPGPIKKRRSQKSSAIICVPMLPKEYKYFEREADRLGIPMSRLVIRPWREQWSKEGKGK